MGNDANKDLKEFTETVVEAGNVAEDTTKKFEELFKSIQFKIEIDDNAFDDFDDSGKSVVVHKISDELKEALYNVLNDIIADLEKSVTTDELNKKFEAFKPKSDFARDYLDQGQMQGFTNRVTTARQEVPKIEANNIIASIDEKTAKFTSPEQYNELITKEIDPLIEDAQKSERDYLRSELQKKRASLESDANSMAARIKKDEILNPIIKKRGELDRFQSQLQGKSDNLKKDLDVDAYLPEDIEKKQQQIKKDLEELQKYLALPIFKELEGYSDYVNKTVETGFKEIAELDRDVASELKSYGDINAESYTAFVNSLKEQLERAKGFLPDTKIDPGFGDFVKQVDDLPKKMKDYKKAAGDVVKNVKTAEFTKLLDDATRKVQDSKAGDVNNTVDKSELQNTITELDDKFNSFDKALQKSFRSKYTKTRDKLSSQIGALEKEEAKGGPKATSDEFEAFKKDIEKLQERVKRAIPKDIASLSNEEKAKLIKKLDKLGSDVRAFSNTSENFKKTILSGSIKNATGFLENCNSALLNATKAAGGSIDKFVENAEQLNKRAAQLEKSAAAEDLRKTINREITSLASTKLTDSYKSRYEKLITAKKTIEDKAKELETDGKLSKDEIESRTSATLKVFEKEITSVSGELIRSYFKDNIAGAKAAIDALGDKEKISKLDAPAEIKAILSEATDEPGELSGIINGAYEEQVAKANKDAIAAATKELDALKAKKDLAKGTFERSRTEDNGNDYLKALEAYRDKMDKVPEGAVKEDQKAAVTNEIEKLKETLNTLDDLVTEKIDELTKDVSKTISNIKQDRTLSTKEKIDAVQGQLGRLEDATPVSTGDVKALAESKDATQRALNNLQAQYADEQTRAAKQATQQVLSSVKSIVSGIEHAMNTVVSIIRRGLSLLNKAINFTINSLKSVITGAQKIIQLVGSLSNRVRSFVGNLLNANKAGERSNVIVKSVGLTFTELNSAISLVERAFNALFNNKMLERAMKFDSTIASITMLLGNEATADVRDFADALETGFGVPATKTISDLQEISSLLKGAGIQTEYIANASEDLYSMANYMAALGMAGGDVSEVMTKLQSGLKGMTQSIDDLGLSVRETQMDEFLRDNGYNVKFSGLSEANREIVRLAAIISQFRKSFNISDYPKLMKNTYFQISLVKTQIEEIGTLIGKIFEGLLKNILPFVMKAVYTIKSAVIGIGESLGIDMGFGETESQASEASAAVDEVTESTKEATKAAKEYSGAAGFDKLESLSSGSSSGSGSGDTDMSSLLANVGNISDELIKIARDSDGFIDAVDKEIRKRLKKLKKDIQEYVDDLLGHHVDLSFGFDKDSAKASLDGIWENIKRWWESVSETGLWLSFRFAEDIQIGRLSNDLLSIIESITKIVAVIQEALEPVIKKLYDEYLSPIVKDIGDGIHNFADGLAGLADVIEAMFSGDKSLADVKKMIDDLAETHPKFAALADDILTIKENWKGFIDIWNGKDTKKAKKLEEAFPVITQLEKTIKSITELTSTLWSDYLKPLFKHIRKNMPTPEQLLKNLQDAVDKINEVLGKDSTKITITDAASSVLQTITNKAKALKKILKSISKVVISLITPTDENGNVASKEDGGSSVLSLLADSMSNFVDNEFTEWLDEVTDDLTKFIQENKEDIVKVIDDLRDFAWDAFKTVVQKIIKLFKWVVTHEEDVKKVLKAINRAFRFVVNNAEALISVFVALKGLRKIASGATEIVSVLKAIKELKGLNSGGEAAGEAASILSASTIKIAGEATLIIGTALLGYEVGKEFGEAFIDIGERLADLKTKYDEKAMTALLASLYAESTTGTIESMKEAQDQLWRDFKLTVEDLKPFEYTDKYGIPQLDMSRLSVDAIGTVRTVASNGSVILAKSYEDVEAELAKVAQKQEAEEKKVKDREKRNSRTSAQKIADGVNGVPSSISEMSKDIVDAIKTAGKESRKKSLTALEAIRDGIGGIPSGVKDTVKELKGINTILGSTLNPDTGGKATATEEEKKGKAAIKARADKEKTKRKEARALLKSPKTTEAISENPKLILKYLDAFKVEKQKKIKEAVNAYTLSIKNAKDSREVDSALKTFKESLHVLKIPGFKSGGSIGKGSLFIANENGSATELIGNITKRSGTDVANNKMITDAMEVAVYNGFAEAFNQMQTNNVNSNQTQTINISGFGMIDKTTLKKLAQLLTPYLDATNKSLITT